jgi:hypothetical protein
MATGGLTCGTTPSKKTRHTSKNRVRLWRQQPVGCVLVTLIGYSNGKSGEFPVGAYFGRGTPNTANLLPIMWKEMGHKMLYTSEVYNEDSPYWIDLPWEKDLPEEEKEGLLMVPYNYDCRSQVVLFFFSIIQHF